MMINKKKTPICAAIKKLSKKNITYFDVPAHKRRSKELISFFGKKCVDLDFNSLSAIDNANFPCSVILKSEKLMASFFKAKHAFFMLNGTTSAVQTMLFYSLKQGDKIIIPKDAHKCVINAINIIKAIPIFINSNKNKNIKIEDVKKLLKNRKNIKAILINNPNYYGRCTALQKIVKLAHRKNIKVLVDEAHGTHFSLSNKFPISGILADADMVSVSMHKTGCSFTQSAVLLINKNINYHKTRAVINQTQSTSSSYLLMCSLELARLNLEINKEKYSKKLMFLYRHFFKRMKKSKIFQLKYTDDCTKIYVNVEKTNKTGFYFYKKLRKKYKIQVEFGDNGGFLIYLTTGNKKEDVDILIKSLKELERLCAS